MPNLAIKKTKEIIIVYCLVVLSLVFATDTYAVGAKGELICYNSCEIYSIKTTVNYYSKDQATQGLYSDALVFCSDKGGLENYSVNYFFSAENFLLPGTSWEVTSYNDGQGLIDINFYKELVIHFGRDGIIQGISFCNGYAGYYTVFENQISMGPAATFGLCEGLMRQEELFLEALRAATIYETRGDQLILKDGNGTAVALLARK
ncbi:Heat shock protein HslJ [Candidatus Electrothrix aarhusensis]|uniref:Heat shock protein HslJ n=1 Tax=Candidatus Electrothrix aarhusensis TaxID=1859131 RepID=A0A3S3QZP4_9BACT|nr:Heat shock protein HslJ [Candidatus Electrothrix aarhusensis]